MVVDLCKHLFKIIDENFSLYNFSAKGVVVGVCVVSIYLSNPVSSHFKVKMSNIYFSIKRGIIKNTLPFLILPDPPKIHLCSFIILIKKNNIKYKFVIIYVLCFFAFLLIGFLILFQIVFFSFTG